MDDEDAEATRLRWLEEDIVVNQACPPNGAYKVVQRTPLLVHTSLIGVHIYNVVYDIACS